MSPSAAVPLSSIAPLAQLFKEGTLSAATASSSSLFTNVAHRISLYRGDITKLEVDAIVNAANETLLGGGGVDGAIHRAAGAKLKEECKTLGGCKTGEAKSTKAYDLPCKNVIHTVGPIFAKSRAQESKTALASAYRQSLDEAVKVRAHSIAFPSISTGVYGYPMEEATDVALRTVATFLTSEKGKSVQRVIFCVFSERDYNVYLTRIPEHIASSSSSSSSDE